MKIINFELSKRLNEEGVLEGIETEFMTNEDGDINSYNHTLTFGLKGGYVRTLTLEKAIDLLPSFILEKVNFKDEKGNILLKSYNIKIDGFETGKVKKLIFAVERTLEYLLDNELLGQK